MLNALAQFADLKAAARTSAFSFDGKDVDLREVGETEIARYVDAHDSLQERLASPMPAALEDHVQMVLAFARHRPGESVDTDFWSRVDETNEFHLMNPWISCSILARFGRHDACASLLRTAYDRGQVFPFGRSIWALLSGPLEMPDNVRRDPEYHAL